MRCTYTSVCVRLIGNICEMPDEPTTPHAHTHTHTDIFAIRQHFVLCATCPQSDGFICTYASLSICEKYPQWFFSHSGMHIIYAFIFSHFIWWQFDDGVSRLGPCTKSNIKRQQVVAKSRAHIHGDGNERHATTHKPVMTLEWRIYY